MEDEKKNMKKAEETKIPYAETEGSGAGSNLATALPGSVSAYIFIFLMRQSVWLFLWNLPSRFGSQLFTFYSYVSSYRELLMKHRLTSPWCTEVQMMTISICIRMSWLQARPLRKERTLACPCLCIALGTISLVMQTNLFKFLRSAAPASNHLSRTSVLKC